MKWTSKDMKLYLQEESYFDTVLLQLTPLSFDGTMRRAAAKTEFSSIICSELERNLAGRILLLPPFTYTQSEENKKERLSQWEKELSSKFKYIFFITYDEFWKAEEHDFKSRLIWTPYMPFEEMDESYLQKIVSDQTEQIMNILLQLWTA